jgi:putative hemolysin
MPIYINILLILVLFFFNAVFAMYEIAMVSARRTRLHQRADDGQSGANLAIKLQNDQTRSIYQQYRS